jgi:hypothetical protein
MTEFTTTDDAIVLFDPKDLDDYLAHGDALWTKLDLDKTHRWWPHKNRLWWRSWAKFCRSDQLKTQYWGSEKLVADLLEWGRGIIFCPTCDVTWLANDLTMQEWRMDGIDRRQFCCPMGDCVLLTHKNSMGCIDELIRCRSQIRRLVAMFTR